MKKFTDFGNQNDLYELKPGWVVRIPPWFTQMDMAKWRFDPVTIGIVMLGVGTAIQMKGTLEQGKEAKKIANARAAVDIENAKAVRRTSVEEAKIKKARGRRLLATQKSVAAAAGVMINVGSPLVIAAETRDIIADDVGFILERGRAETGFFESSAAIETARGEAALRKSKWDAISQGLTGFGSIAFMGTQGGTFKGSSGGSVLANQSLQGPAGLTNRALNSRVSSGGFTMRA